MKIAVLGTKGIPAQFGGIERHCEELYSRMAQRGHDVTVFVRRWYTDAGGHYRGMRLRPAPTLDRKGLDAFIHTGAASVITLGGDFDIVHYHGIGPALFSFVPRIRNTATVATVHALDWQRAKWGRGASRILRAGEWSSARFPQRTIVVSRQLQDYIRSRYGRECVYIPNGVDFIQRPRAYKLVKELGLERGSYLLYLGRLVPEKGCHDLIEAYIASGIEDPLVIAGGSSHSDDYVAELKRRAGSGNGIIFTGNVAGELLRQLSAHAGLFVLPSHLEGLPIVALEMLWLKVPVLASDIEPSLEVLRDGEFGALFRTGDVEQLTRKLVEAYDGREQLKQKAIAGHDHIRIENDWDRIAEVTEDVYREAVSG